MTEKIDALTPKAATQPPLNVGSPVAAKRVRQRDERGRSAHGERAGPGGSLIIGRAHRSALRRGPKGGGDRRRCQAIDTTSSTAKLRSAPSAASPVTWTGPEPKSQGG